MPWCPALCHFGKEMLERGGDLADARAERAMVTVTAGTITVWGMNEVPDGSRLRTAFAGVDAITRLELRKAVEIRVASMVTDVDSTDPSRRSITMETVQAVDGVLARGGPLPHACDVKPLIDESEVALAPVSDESPFFFQMTRWKSLNFRTLRGFAGQSFLEPLAIPVGQISLVAALALGLLLSTFLLALPLARGAVPREGRWSWLLYFLALGVAYISVEVVLMQRLALFLGHPTYSVTTVLFSILLFSGLGSAWSDRRGESPAALARWLRFALPVVIALMVFAVPPLLRTLGGLALVPRVLVAMAVIAPLAFLMGLPFPLAVRVLAASGDRLIPWAWAANGCGSVLGSVGAVLGAMLWNFSIVLIAAAVVYALALSHLARTRAAAGSADAAA